MPELLEEQLTSFGANYNNSPPTTGTPGDYPCANIQASGHMVGADWDMMIVQK